MSIDKVTKCKIIESCLTYLSKKTSKKFYYLFLKEGLYISEKEMIVVHFNRNDSFCKGVGNNEFDPK
jgi:hypothetical protein